MLQLAVSQTWPAFDMCKHVHRCLEALVQCSGDELPQPLSAVEGHHAQMCGVCNVYQCDELFNLHLESISALSVLVII